jgi:hypothetical protein
MGEAGPDLSQPFDLVVVGAGAAGLAAASRAVDLGGRVLLLEKGSQVGGSAALSAGILWTAPDLEVARRIQPDGDPVLTRLVVEGYEQAVADVRAAGTSVSPEWLDHLEWGRACKIDIAGLFARWSAKVADSSGGLLTDVRDVALSCDQTGVSGVRFRHAGETRGAIARATVLATGGFQGDPELKQRFIGGGADDIAVRSNPRSVGDGFRLGSAAGAAASRHLSGFYGHTLPSPVPVTPEVFLRLTLYFSAYGVIVKRLGRRFTTSRWVMRCPTRSCSVNLANGRCSSGTTKSISNAHWLCPTPAGWLWTGTPRLPGSAPGQHTRTRWTNSYGWSPAGGSTRRPSSRPSRATSERPRARPSLWTRHCRNDPARCGPARSALWKSNPASRSPSAGFG